MGQIQHLVVMGVAGCGKSTFGQALGGALGWPVDEGDAFHPKSNIDKMRAGIALEDADRAPWLDALVERLRERRRAGQSSVLICSSLKRAYRDRLRTAGEGVRFIHLDGDRALLARRLSARSGHFFPASLLASQLAALEPLGEDEDGVVIGIDRSAGQQVRECFEALNLG
jgi:carbohydrate kinase (thermoresistant glucokinase family)